MGVFISSTFTLWKQLTDPKTIVLLLLFFIKYFKLEYNYTPPPHWHFPNSSYALHCPIKLIIPFNCGCVGMFMYMYIYV